MPGAPRTPPEGAPRVGDAVGDLVIEELLAAGATTATYRARSATLGRPVRLKVLAAASFAGDPGERERARQEAVRAARLEHPGLAGVFSAGEHEGGLYVATALVAGTPLPEAVRDREVTAEQVPALVNEMAAGLAAAHAAGVLHHGLRPEVVVLSRWGAPVITDFGITRLSGSTGLATRLELVEALRHQAPELILGEPAGIAADVYGLASVTLFCLTGLHPHPADPTPAALIERRLAGPPPLDGVPDAAVPVLAEALALDPARRPASVTDFAAALATALGAPVAPAPLDLPSAPDRAGSPPTPTPPTETERTPPPGPTPQPEPPRSVPDAGATRVDRRREPPPPPVVPQRPRGPVVACALAVVFVGMVAFGLGRMGAPDAPEPPRVAGLAVRAGDVRVLPAAAAPAPSGPGSALGTPLRVRVPGGRATIGTLTGGTPTDPVLATLADAPRPSPVRSGDRALLRYAFDGASLFALPLGDTTLAAACDDGVAPPRCAGLVSTIEIGDRRPAAIRPAPGPAKALGAALLELEQARGRAAVGLNGRLAERPGAADAVREAYGEAATAVGATGLPDAKALQAPMRAAAAAFGELANAIERRSEARYDLYRDRARRAERELRARVRTLERSGFEVNAS